MHPCCLLLAAVGAARPRGGWRSSVSARLQGFLSFSSAAVPHQWSSVGMITSLVLGRSKPGCGLCPALSFKDVHHLGWVGGRTELGPASVWAGDPFLPPAFGGEGHPPALRRRCPPATRGKANCCYQDRVQLSVFHPGDSGRLHRGVAQHIVRREGGTRVPRRSRSRSYGESGSEDLLVRFGAAAARWCGVGGQVAAVVGAEVVVAIGEAASTEAVASADEIVDATYSRTSGSLALMACPRPSCGDVGEGLFTAVIALRSSLLMFSRSRQRSLSLPVERSPASHLEFVIPQALWCGGCSYPREWNRSPVCNSTLSMGVCSLWLLRPKHLGI
jgi:hypothetical protein